MEIGRDGDRQQRYHEFQRCGAAVMSYLTSQPPPGPGKWISLYQCQQLLKYFWAWEWRCRRGWIAAGLVCLVLSRGYGIPFAVIGIGICRVAAGTLRTWRSADRRSDRRSDDLAVAEDRRDAGDSRFPVRA